MNIEFVTKLSRLWAVTVMKMPSWMAFRKEFVLILKKGFLPYYANISDGESDLIRQIYFMQFVVQ